MLDFSNESSPALPAATCILIRTGGSGLEILLLRRSKSLKHMPDLWVFPGGKVDAEDSGIDEQSSARSAAVRELEEEAGITLLETDLLCFSHWTTPVKIKRRFATWFFLAAAPRGTKVVVDGQEIVDFQWLTPELAICSHESGSLPLTPPTLVSLYDLRKYDTLSSLHSALKQRSPPQFFPKMIRQANQMTFLYHGDASYESGNLSLEGTVHRTISQDGKFYYLSKRE